MSLRERTRPGLGIIEPCLPSPAKAPPSGPGWIYEIKHDGFRILARRDSAAVRLITRAGNDFSGRFPFIAMAVSKLPVRSCLIDGEAIVCDENGLAVFDLIRRHGALASAVHCAFDLLELDGRDLRREPIEKRKELLAELLRGSKISIVLNEHFEEDGATVFREACRLGCEGIVSKRLGSLYRSGRSPHWVKVKNPKAPAVEREAEEDWGGTKSTSARFALAEPCGLLPTAGSTTTIAAQESGTWGTKVKPLVTHHRRLCLFEPPSLACRFPPPRSRNKTHPPNVYLLGRMMRW
jgi:bifunctional non-homologous end joining protein LigD